MKHLLVLNFGLGPARHDKYLQVVREVSPANFRVFKLSNLNLFISKMGIHNTDLRRLFLLVNVIVHEKYRLFTNVRHLY